MLYGVFLRGGRMSREIRSTLVAAFLVAFAVGLSAQADGARDNVADKVRPIPPLPTKEISEADRAELEAGGAQLGGEVGTLKNAPGRVRRVETVSAGWT